MSEPWEMTAVERLEARRLAQRLAPVYRVLDWRWGSGKEMRVPDEVEIELTIVGLVERARKRGDKIVSTGGLVAHINEPDPTCAPSDENDPDNHLGFFVQFQP